MSAQRRFKIGDRVEYDLKDGSGVGRATVRDIIPAGGLPLADPNIIKGDAYMIDVDGLPYSLPADADGMDATCRLVPAEGGGRPAGVRMAGDFTPRQVVAAVFLAVLILAATGVAAWLMTH